MNFTRNIFDKLINNFNGHRLPAGALSFVPLEERYGHYRDGTCSLALCWLIVFIMSLIQYIFMLYWLLDYFSYKFFLQIFRIAYCFSVISFSFLFRSVFDFLSDMGFYSFDFGLLILIFLRKPRFLGCSHVFLSSFFNISFFFYYFSFLQSHTANTTCTGGRTSAERSNLTTFRPDDLNIWDRQVMLLPALHIMIRGFHSDIFES